MGSRQTTTSEGAASSRPLRAIGYLRVSTSGQAEHGLGLEAQRETVTLHATEQGWELVDVVAEAASGGIRNGEEVSDEHRPVLQSLVERAQADEYNVLLVAKLDRLSRDHASLVILERRLQKAGVEVVSVAEHNGEGAFAAFIRGQVAAIAELERSMILDRVTKGKAQGRKRGAYVGGGIPHGYVSAREAGRLEVDRLEKGAPVKGSPAAIVRRIFKKASAGKSASRIAQELNRQKIASPKGAGWSRQGVTVLIRNPTYYGELFGQRGAQPAIVSRRLWNAANAGLDAHRKGGQ